MNNARINVRIPVIEHRLLCRVSRRAGLTLSAWVRMVLVVQATRAEEVRAMKGGAA